MRATFSLCVRASFVFAIVLLCLIPFMGTASAEVRTMATPQVRVTSRVDNNKRKTLYGHVPHALRHATKLGRVDPSTAAEHLILALKSSPDQEREIRRVVDEQQDRKTGNFHQWMKPEEFGAHFGVHDSDLENLKAWLSSQGFTVESVTKAKRSIQFSGTVGQIEQAFHTEMHYFAMPNGEIHVSNDRDISVPAALSPVIAGVPTLHNFFRKSHSQMERLSRMRLGPQFTPSSGTNYVGPADFATIYNTAPLLQQGIDGTGVTIAVVGRSDILLSDVQTYRQLFNLPVNDPVFIHAGQDPGVLPGDDGESDLDVEISGGVAPGATVKFVIGTPTFLVDGITNSIQYIVENNAADIMSLSYGDCEANEGAGGNSFNSAMFEQAAAQGISVFIAQGDNGPSGCDDSNDSYEVLGYAAGAEGSTPYGVAVGGTQFDEGSGTYWTTNNNALNLESALSYIPEYPWNEAKGANPTTTPSGDLSGLWSGSGGISAYYLQPSWQRGPGIGASDPVLTLGGGATGLWVTGITITTAGSGYTSAPSVTFTGGGCASEPTATSVISGGAVTGIVFNYGTQGGSLKNGQGFGCTSAPTIAFGAAPAGGTTAAANASVGQMQNPSPLISGVPHRLTPDVALNAAADHDGTLFCSEGICQINGSGQLEDAGIVGGTSVAAPSMAGVQALIDQANGGRQGMPAYIYYTLAANQNTTNCNSSLPPTNSSGCAFQDITVGNNLICGLSSCSTTSPAAKIGFQAGTGYDLATGLGSVNVANLASQWSSVIFSSSNVTLGLSQTSFVHGTPITLSGAVAPGSGLGTPTGDVAFIVSQGAIGDTVNTDTGALNGPAAFTTLSGGSYSAVLNNLPGGTYYVTARYGGDETYGSSYSTPVQVTVQAENDTLNLTAYALSGSACTLTSGSTFAYDSDIWLDAQVTANSGAGAPTGTIAITLDGNPYTTLTLDPNGHAFALSGSIGTSNCLYGYDYANTATIVSGAHTIAASYSGDAAFDATNATTNITVTQLTPSLSLAAGATQITAGFNDQLTATFGSLPATGQQIGTAAPTGTVTFTDTTTSAVLGTAPVVSTLTYQINEQLTSFASVAQLQTTGITTAGANSITATYNGDTNFKTATSSAATVTVATYTNSTATAVTSNANPTTLNGRPTFTATVTGATNPTSGTVTFYDGTTVLGTGSVGSSHTATLRLASGFPFYGGNHNITATFGGVTGTFGPSTSPVFVEMVTQGTITHELTAKTVGLTGQNYTFTDVITPSSTNSAFLPTAAILFFDGANQIGSGQLISVATGLGGYGIYEGSVTVNTLSSGTHTITAQYPGDVNYPASTSNTQTVFVGGTPTLTWGMPAAISYGTPLSSTQLNATDTIPGTYVYNPPAGTVLNVGPQNLAVTFTPGDYKDFSTQNANVTLMVNQATQAITFTQNPPGSAQYNTSFTVAATGGLSGNPVVFTSAGVCSNVGGTYTMISGTGTCSVIANQAGNSNYQAAPQLTVPVAATLASQSITFTTNAPANAAYASTFGVAATASSGDAVVFTSSGSCSNVGGTYTMISGAGTCSVIADQPGDSNYGPAPELTETTGATPANSASIASSLDSAIYPNQSTTLSATVTGAGASPSGTVTFMLGANVLGTGNLLANGPNSSTTSVPLAWSQLAQGANTIFAVYSGSVNYITSTSPNFTVTLSSPFVTFGNISVGTAATLQTLTYQFSSAATLSAVDILTSGAAGRDYTDGGSSSCSAGTAYTAGSSCTVTVAFTPTAPGARSGAAVLFAQGSNLPLMTWYVSGTGKSSAVTIDPGTQTTLGTISGGTPYGSAVDGNGNVYVVDHTNSQVVEIAAGTLTQSVVVTGLNGPTAVAVDGSGNLYISDTKNDRVVMVPNENGTLNGADMSVVNISGLGAPHGLATDVTGNLYVADATNGNVVEVPAGGGTAATVVSGLTNPTGVAVDVGGNVYVAAGNAVSEYPFGGGAPIALGNGYNNPRGLAVDAAGTVYVADTGNGRIVEVAAGGASQAVFPISGITDPQSVALDSSDNVYVTNDSDAVYQVNRTQAAALVFPSTNVGSTSPAQTLTVSDAGNTNLVVTSLAISAQFVQQNSGGTNCTSSSNLSSGAQCLIAIAFAPTQSGTVNGTVTLTDNALNATSTQTVQLAGGGSQQSQTITFTTNAPASAPYNSSFTVAATASSGLAVTFTSAGSCSNVGATYTMTSGTGTCTVIANQAGNNEYSPAPQMTESTAATQIGQTITFTTNAPGTAIYGTSFTVAASASSGLAVVYSSAGACSNMGATYTMTSGTGTCAVTASQPGNNDYSAATPVNESTTAVRANQTVSFTGAPALAPYNGTFVLLASTNASTVAYITSSNSSVCSLSGPYSPVTVTMLKAAGKCTFTAQWGADQNYNPATATQNTTAEKATPVITWATPAPISYGTALSGTQLDATANVAGSFTYLPAAGKIETAGNDPLKVTFKPTSTNYASTTDTVTLQVLPAATTTKITSSDDTVKLNSHGVATATLDFNVTSYRPTGSVTLTASTGEVCSGVLNATSGNGSCKLTFTTTGTRTIVASYGGDANHSGSNSSGQNPPVTVTVNPF
jgi:sugar lactone lactonase YvrE